MRRPHCSPRPWSESGPSLVWEKVLSLADLTSNYKAVVIKAAGKARLRRASGVQPPLRMEWKPCRSVGVACGDGTIVPGKAYAFERRHHFRCGFRGGLHSGLVGRCGRGMEGTLVGCGPPAPLRRSADFRDRARQGRVLPFFRVLEAHRHQDNDRGGPGPLRDRRHRRTGCGPASKWASWWRHPGESSTAGCRRAESPEEAPPEYMEGEDLWGGFMRPAVAGNVLPPVEDFELGESALASRPQWTKPNVRACFCRRTGQEGRAHRGSGSRRRGGSGECGGRGGTGCDRARFGSRPRKTWCGTGRQSKTALSN